MLADMLLEGGPSPFAAKMTASDKIAYYESQFYLPDGTPNQVGRQQELQRLGVPDYVKALAQMQKIHDLYTPAPNTGEFLG